MSISEYETVPKRAIDSDATAWAVAVAKLEGVIDDVTARLDALGRHTGPFSRPLPPTEAVPVSTLESVPTQEPSPAVRALQGATIRLGRIDQQITDLIDRLDT